MALKITPVTVVVGQKQDLELAQGEDRQFDIAFQEPAGVAKDLTGAQAIVLTARSRGSGATVVSRNYAGFASGATGGVASFVFSSIDSINQPVGPYDLSAYWKDASGYQEQLLVASTLRIDKEAGQAGDVVTSAPPPPVVFGLNWLAGQWSSPTGGYNRNDAVQAYDGSLGATAVSSFRALVQGVTYYPIGPTGALNTGWAYVGQHGGIGATGVAGVAGVTGPQGATGAAGAAGATGVGYLTPGTTGAIAYDNGSGYARVSPGTVNQVLVGGPSPSWGFVPDAALPTKIASGTYGTPTGTYIGQIIVDERGRVTSITTRNPDWVNVKDFGAKGDGVTDDAAAIQAAIDSIRDTGGIVFFPIGEYLINSALSIFATVSHAYANIELRGCGYKSHIFPGVAIGAHNGTYPYSPINFVGRTAYGLKNCGIRNMRISGFDTATLQGPILTWVNTDGGFLIDSFIDTCPVEGASWNSPNSDQNAICEGNYATNIGGWGVATIIGPLSAFNVNANNASIRENQSFQCAIAVEFTGSDATIENNIFEYCGAGVVNSWQYCMSLESTLPGSRLNVTGNIVRYAGQAIAISTSNGSGDSMINDNICSNIDTGISVSNTSGTVTLDNNTFYDTATAGAGSGACIKHLLGSTASLVCTNNKVTAGPTGTWAYGFSIQDGSLHNLLEGNTVIGAAINSVVFIATSTSTGASGTWHTRWVRNAVFASGLSDTVPRYQIYGGIPLSKAQIAGIDDVSTEFGNGYPALIFATGAPSVGTWNAGDRAINMAPSASGISRWLCTASGPTGATWTPHYVQYLATGGGVTFSGPYIFVPSGGISNAMLANNAIGVVAGTGLTGGGAPQLGQTATINLPAVGPGSTNYGGGIQFISSVQVDAYGRVIGATAGTPAGVGTVSSVGTDNTLTGGPITASGVLGINLGNSNTWTAPQQWPAGTGIAFGGNPVTIFESVSGLTSVGSGILDALVYNLPTGTLSANGQMIRMQGNFTHGSGTNTSVASLVLAGAAGPNTTLATSNGNFAFECRLVRTGPTTATVNTLGQTTAGTTVLAIQKLTGLNFNTALPFKMQVTATNLPGDLAADYMRLDWWP